MAEFCVYPEQLKAQANRLDDVASSITATQIKVAAAVSGLGPIGLAEVGPNILAIEARLLKHKMTVQSMSEALMRIKQRFELAEATIQGEVLQYIIDQIIEGAVDGISQFVGGVNDWIDAFGAFLNGEISGPTFTLLDFEGLGSALGIDLSLFNFSGNQAGLFGQLFDENGNFNPQAFGFFSGEGSIFSLDANFNLGDLLHGSNQLTFGEYNIDTLFQAGIIDEYGHVNPQFAAYFDGEFIELHDVLTINDGFFHQSQTELKIGDVVIHGGIGNTLYEMGLGGYASATALDITQTDRYGLSFLNVYNQSEIAVCSAEAGAGIDFGLLDQNGHFNPHFFVGEVADASVLSVTDTVGVSIAGIDIGAGASVSLLDAGEGVYAYMHDGQIVVNTGIGIGEGGASLVLSMDMSNSAIYQYGQAGVDYFVSGQAATDVANAYNYVASGEAWHDAQNAAYGAYDYVASGEAWHDVQSAASDAYDYVSSGEAWSDFKDTASDTADYIFGGGLVSDIVSWGVGH